MCGNAPGILGFVKTRLLETDREGAHRNARIFLVERADRRAVDAAGEESADRDVGHRLAGNGRGEGALELLQRLSFIVDRLFEPGADHVAVRPVRLETDAAGPAFPRRLAERGCGGIHVDGEDARRWQLEHALVDRQRRWNVGPRRKQPKRPAGYPPVQAWMHSKRLQLRAEHEVSAGPAVVKRLLAEAVADQADGTLAPGPQS